MHAIKLDCAYCLDNGDEPTCKECCPHDFDAEEGMMCLNCGAEFHEYGSWDEDSGRDR